MEQIRRPFGALSAALLLTAAPVAFAQEADAPAHTLSVEAPVELHAYYDQGGKRLWSGDREARRRLDELVSVLESDTYSGIARTRYGLDRIRAAKDSANADALEAAASLAFTSLALDLRSGRIDPLINITEDAVAEREASRTEILKMLAEKGSVEDVLRNLRTDNPVQKELLAILDRYKRYAEEEAWSPITISSDVLEEGATGDDVAAVIDRLAAEGFYSKPRFGGSSTPTYDSGVAEAVKRFQKSRGIVPDGVVGPNTLERMNETPQQLVEKIRLNLERARWLPQDFADRYLMVNIADFTVGAWEDEKQKFSIRTVVGTDYNKTPVFADEMEYVVANPYWNIPASILVNEIAPQQAKDPGYLASKNMEVVEGWGDDAPVIDPSQIDWNTVTGNETWRVRQRGGPNNALGLIKFMFPNDYAVYLHDTPAESLFDETRRTFSHGCIRVEEPRKLAEWVLEGTEWEGRDRVDQLIDSGERRTVSLAEPIPVYVTYFTV
ncbi:L,D-transpeptidase family protein [Parvularcula lutaonensis]|uniref:Murein L,D-transpeptidase n=1 Tax=Parvularcula lutaonensis TaxID=491923 RepID=A0ABV7MC34_9PROT|nr:L,D-transpeptidase family protein [Parvularcula lutaonensis]GGY49834.1 murein L,D-transpeptidase [Parvularcula lutaonensis]